MQRVVHQDAQLISLIFVRFEYAMIRREIDKTTTICFKAAMKISSKLSHLD